MLPVLLLLALTVGLSEANYPGPCDDEIYCAFGEGTLMHTVQMARIYKDSKTFVDQPIKGTQRVVLSNFDKLMQDTGGRPNQNEVRSFVDANFEKEGTEFEDWEPEDWQPDPAFLDKIDDPDYLSLAKDIHSRWKDLGRKIKPELRLRPERTSLIYLEQPFVVPGGRFREMYYWDSYWTVLGLLLSEMNETVKGMLENFSHLVDTIGLIPNGNRIYYTRRSQPPLYIAMMDEYHKATGDDAFIRDNLDSMDREFTFWMSNRMVTIHMDNKDYKMARYNVEVDGPRPESYYEDYRDGQNFSTPEKRLEFYFNMKSGAESGWDYSSKWFIGSDGQATDDLLDIHTRDIVPVELNSYLCRNSLIMERFHNKFGSRNKAESYKKIADHFKEGIDTLLWNDELGAWFDYDMVNEKQRLQFYPSNVAPLWADCYPQTKLKEKVKPVVKYLQTTRAMTYPGGVPTSLKGTGQQWDFSNAWPPLQEIIVTGLENTGDEDAKQLAFEISQKWVLNNWKSYTQSDNSMFEKYDVKTVGLPGGGGEYDVQEGFGWTNGVLLTLLDRYGDRLASDDVINTATTFNINPLAVLVSTIIALRSF